MSNNELFSKLMDKFETIEDKMKKQENKIDENDAKMESKLEKLEENIKTKEIEDKKKINELEAKIAEPEEDKKEKQNSLSNRQNGQPAPENTPRQNGQLQDLLSNGQGEQHVEPAGLNAPHKSLGILDKIVWPSLVNKPFVPQPSNGSTQRINPTNAQNSTPSMPPGYTRPKKNLKKNTCRNPPPKKCSSHRKKKLLKNLIEQESGQV